MKRFILSVLTCVIVLGTQAQIVSSRSVSIKTEKRPSNTTYFIRAGIGFMNAHGDAKKYVEMDEGNVGSKIGYNLVYGFQKSLSLYDLYWGMDFGFGSRGGKLDYYDKEDGTSTFVAHNIQISPINVGWKPSLTADIKLDVHAGLFASIDYAGKMKDSDYSLSLSEVIDELDREDTSYKRFDIGMNIGVGIWYDRYNIDLTYQTGFIEAVVGAKSNNVLLRLGVAF